MGGDKKMSQVIFAFGRLVLVVWKVWSLKKLQNSKATPATPGLQAFL
jgi:hypothetical protein